MANPLSGVEWPRLVSVRYVPSARAEGTSSPRRQRYEFKADGPVRHLWGAGVYDRFSQVSGQTFTGQIGNGLRGTGKPIQSVYLAFGPWHRKDVPDDIHAVELSWNDFANLHGVDAARQASIVRSEMNKRGANTQGGGEIEPAPDRGGVMQSIGVSRDELSQLAIGVGVLVALVWAISQIDFS